jgi:hypothetical protein
VLSMQCCQFFQLFGNSDGSANSEICPAIPNAGKFWEAGGREAILVNSYTKLAIEVITAVI